MFYIFRYVLHMFYMRLTLLLDFVYFDDFIYALNVFTYWCACCVCASSCFYYVFYIVVIRFNKRFWLFVYMFHWFVLCVSTCFGKVLHCFRCFNRLYMLLWTFYRILSILDFLNIVLICNWCFICFIFVV